ncbi:vac8 [Symbiodinium sp. KB8]|nr:vac8 [Symbiodinium sp. KB8]
MHKTHTLACSGLSRSGWVSAYATACRLKLVTAPSSPACHSKRSSEAYGSLVQRPTLQLFIELAPPCAAERREQIVKLGGLELLLPLAESPDTEVQRLAAHALANLSVSPDNQASIAAEGGIDILVKLLGSTSEKVVQQAAKGLANLGVNSDNKASIAAAGGIPPLIQHAASPHAKVRLEAIAALANLAVNDDNERSIGEQGGLEPILAAAQGTQDGELLAQCARALRNLSVDSANKERLLKLGGTEVLLAMAGHSLEKVSQQSNRALANLRASANRSSAAAAGGEGGAARHK